MKKIFITLAVLVLSLGTSMAQTLRVNQTSGEVLEIHVSGIESLTFVEYALEFSNVVATPNAVGFTVKANDTELSYAFQVFNKEVVDAMGAQVWFEQGFIPWLTNMGAGYGMTLDQVIATLGGQLRVPGAALAEGASTSLQGVMVRNNEVLEANTEYYILAFGLGDDGSLTSDIQLIPFKTAELPAAPTATHSKYFDATAVAAVDSDFATEHADKLAEGEGKYCVIPFTITSEVADAEVYAMVVSGDCTSPNMVIQPHLTFDSSSLLDGSEKDFLVEYDKKSTLLTAVRVNGVWSEIGRVLINKDAAGASPATEW